MIRIETNSYDIKRKKERSAGLLKEELKSNNLSFFILSDVFFTKKAIRSTLEGKMWAGKYSLNFDSDLATTEDFLNFLPQLKADILFLDTRLLGCELQQVILLVKDKLPQSFIVLLNDSVLDPINDDSNNNVVILEKPLHNRYLIRTIDSILEQANKTCEFLEKDNSSLSQKQDIPLIQITDKEIIVGSSEAEMFEKNTVAIIKETENDCQKEQIVSNKTETLFKITDTFDKKDENYLKTEDISLKTEEKSVTITENISKTDNFSELEPQIIEEDIIETEETSFSFDLTSSDSFNEVNEVTFDDFYGESNSNQEVETDEQPLITFDLETTFSTESDKRDVIESSVSRMKEEEKEETNDTFITFELDSPLKVEESKESDENIAFSLEEETVFVLPNDQQDLVNDSSIESINDDLFVQIESDSLSNMNHPIDSDISFDLNLVSNQELNELNNDLTFDLTSNQSFAFPCDEQSKENSNSSLLVKDNQNEIKLDFKSEKERPFKLNETNSFHSNSSLNIEKESFEKTVTTTTFSESPISKKSPNSKNEYKNGAPLYNETTPSFSVQNDLNFNLDIDAMDSDDKDDEIVITPPKAFYPSGVDRQTQRLNKVRNQHQNQWGPKK